MTRLENERKSAGAASLRGQGAPAYLARLRSERTRNSVKKLSYRQTEKPLKNLSWRNGRKVQIQPAEILAAGKLRAGMNQEAGNLPAKKSTCLPRLA